MRGHGVAGKDGNQDQRQRLVHDGRRRGKEPPGDDHGGRRRMSSRTLKAVIGLLVVLAAVGLDQGTKQAARAGLQGRPRCSW